MSIKLSIQTLVLILFGAIVVIATPIVNASTLPNVRVSRVDETTHVEFDGSKKWNYQVDRTNPKLLTVTMDSIAPEAQKVLKAYKDGFVQNVQVSEKEGRVEIQFQLADQSVEHFDYMTDDPSLLIIDFYKKADEEKAEEKSKKPAVKKTLKVAAKKPTAKAQSRAPSSKEILLVEPEEDAGAGIERRFGAFDAGDQDFDRFQVKEYEVQESAIIASKQNIYLHLPPLLMPVSRLNHWMNLEPEYVVTPKDSKESKEAQLLTTLYYRGRNSLFIKTYEYFTNKYPESEYREILQNVLANIYVKSWVKDREVKDYNAAKNQLSDLIKRYPDSPVTKRNELLLAYMNVERGEALAALESIQKILKIYPKDSEVPYLKFAQAESLMGLKKYADATAEYEELIKSYPGTDIAAQAKYRLGDVAMRSQDWKTADQLYTEALKDKKYEKIFPNAHFNKAEALFWMGEYKASVDEFAQFIKYFPTDPNGAFAMTRIGELFDILGTNKKRSMGAYLESYFRYPDLPGSKIARIRMLTQKMKFMKDKELERSLEEIEGLKKEIGLDGSVEFVNLLIADGFEARSDFQKAFDLLATYYQKHPNSTHGKVIKDRVRHSIANEIKRKSDSGDYLGALKYYQTYAKTWLQGADRIDVDFYRGFSFEQAGVYDQALKFYKMTEDHLKQIVGSSEEKVRKIQENLPTFDRLYLRMAKVMMEQKDYVGSYKALKKVSEAALGESEEKIERTQLMAELFIQRGELEDAEKALALLEDDFKDKKTLLTPVLIKRGQILNNLKKYEAAILSLDKALADKKVSDRMRAQAYEAKADAQIALGLKASAIDTLQVMLEGLESKVPMETSRYKLGELLYEKGDMVSAEKVWKKLDGQAGNVLWKIASEKLEAAKFQKDYSRYIERIPAMSNEPEKAKGGM